MGIQNKDIVYGHSSMIVPGFHLGRLMSPEEVAHATCDRESSVFAGLHRWTLCGDVSPALFDILRRGNMLPSAAERVTAFTAESGVRYAVFAHQIGEFQHRFLLPLYEDKTVQFISETSKHACIGYSLAGDGVGAIVWQSALAPRHIAPLGQLCDRVAQGDDEAVLAEYSGVLQEVADPQRIPSVWPTQVVTHVSLSAVPPLELVGRVASRFGING